MTDHKRNTERETKQALQTLDLLKRQIQSNRIEPDYAIRQIEKVKETIQHLTEEYQTQILLKRFEALYNVSHILGSSLDLSVVLDQVMDAMIQLTGAERGFLMLRDDDGNLEVHTARNYDHQSLDNTSLEYSRTIANRVLDSGEVVLTTNAQEDPRFGDQNSVRQQSLRSIIAAPLRVRNRVIGIVYVENRTIAGLFTDDDRALTVALAGQASVAIDNAILFSDTDEALSKRINELRLLRRIDLQLNQKLDLDQIIPYILETTCRIGEARECHLAIIEEELRQLVVQRTYSNVADYQPHDNILDDSVIATQAQQVLKTSQAMQLATALGYVLFVPIANDSHSLGVLMLVYDHQDDFDPEKQDLIERMITRAAINIENGRFFNALQAADLAKTTLLGIAAHDLKAPMTSIQGYADLILLEDDDLSNRQRDFLMRIVNMVKHMVGLVNNVLDVSRIQGNNLKMEEARVPITPVINAIRDMITPQMEKQQQRFIEQIASDLPDLYTDHNRLMQVLVNLLSNAYKYTPDGGTITLTVRPDGERICFEIADTGVGLSAQEIEKLGVPFWRAENNMTAQKTGTGLGYSITRSIVKQMGSDITIQSTVGEGSTFSFTVAMADDTLEVDEPQP